MNKTLGFVPCSLVCFVGVSLLTPVTYAQTPEPAAPQVLPDVNVTADADAKADDYQKKELSSPRITTPKLDTPQSMTVVPEKLMRDQGVTTLRDALRDVSGISMAAGEGGNQGDNLTLRGFSARSDIYQDGARDFGSYNRDSFLLESVEVIKGPSSALFGRGSTGGVINQVSKAPKEKAFSSATLALGSDNTKRATADLNKPLGNGVGFRLNLMNHFNNVADRDVAENRRSGIAPSLTFGLGSPTRLTISYLHQNESNIPDYGIPYFLSRPADVEDSNYYGFKNHNFFSTEVDVLTAKFEHKFGNGMTVRNQTRHGIYYRHFQISEARLPATATAATPFDTIQVDRAQISGDSKEEAFNNDLSLSARFETGFIKHQAVVGVEATRETSKPKRYAATGVPATNLENPNINQQYAGTLTPSSSAKTTSTTVATYVADSLTFSDAWILTAGARWEKIDSNTDNVTPTATTAFANTDKMTSWRSGLTYKPVSWTSVYVNYGTSFNPSVEGLSLAANTQNLDPEKNKTIEVGSKMEFLGGDLALEGALFRIEKTNARTPDPLDATLNVLTGGQKVDGGEIGLVGRPSARWQISSGYTQLVAKITDTNRPLEKNRTMNNTPKHSGNLWATYLASDRWDIGAGVIGVSSRFGSTVPDAATNKFRKVDGYHTFNAMAKYRLSDDMDVQLNLMNLGDADYFDGMHPGHLIPGAGRSALVSAEFRI